MELPFFLADGSGGSAYLGLDGPIDRSALGAPTSMDQVL